jgi:hypothetical protein
MSLKNKKLQGTALVMSLLLGFVVTPAIAGAATTTTTINSQIGSVISALTSSGTVTADVLPTGAGAQTISSDTVTVSTNNSSGYTLLLADSDATNTLVSGSNTIGPNSGTQGSPVAQTANKWGYRVDSVGGFGAGPTSSQSSAAIGTIKFAPVPINSTPDTLKTTATTASGDTTTVWYGVSANTSQPTGQYTDSVTYTATANP